MAIGDIMFGISHGSDHSYMLINVEQEEPKLCKVFAFFMHWGIQSQSTTSSFVAIAAFLAVVLSKKVSRRAERKSVYSFSSSTNPAVLAG